MKQPNRPSHPGSAVLNRLCSMFCLLLVAWTWLAAGCSEAPAEVKEEKTRPVRIQEAVLEKRPVRLHYIGTTSSQSVRKLGFKVGGKVQRIFVKKGARVEAGQKLARLDTRDLRLAVRASALSLRKAAKAYDEAESFFEKIEKLYRENARPQVEFDRARLNRDISKATLEQARVDYRLKRSMLADCVLRADAPGYVVDTLSKPGEMVGAGFPVILVRTEQQVVSVGVTQQDVKRLHVGTRAQVTIDDLEGEGHVVNIGQVPDRQSRTYTVEVELEGPLAEQAFYIGSIARVAFEVGQSEGIWVPIQSVLTDGVNYVFVVEDGRAVRRNLTLGSASGNFVMVQGLEAGAHVIVEGMKNLKDGYKVDVLEDGARQAGAVPVGTPGPAESG